MKTQNTNNKLSFNKANVTELNEGQLLDVNGGGTSRVCISIAVIFILLAKDQPGK